MPEEVDRARLAAVPAGEPLEHAVRPVENAPEPLDRLPVVGRILAVVRKRRRHRYPEWRLADRHVDVELRQDSVQGLVERSHRQPVEERERLDLTSVRQDDEPMVDEVEDDLERDAV